jgi:hypothetical protein
VKDLWNKDRLGDQHQKVMKDCQGKERGRRSTSEAFTEKNERISEVERGRAAQRKSKEKREGGGGGEEEVVGVCYLGYGRVA